MRNPSYVEVYFRSSVTLWKQLKGPFLSTFLQQLCLTLYQSAQKVHRLRKEQEQELREQVVDNLMGGNDSDPQSLAPLLVSACPTAASEQRDDHDPAMRRREATARFVSCTTLSMKADNSEMLQMHADRPNFNAFTFSPTKPVVQRANGFGASSSSGMATTAVGCGGFASKDVAANTTVKAKMPKKYISAFNYFSRFFRTAVKELEFSIPGARLNEVISNAWKSLDQASKLPLNALAERSKKEYLLNIDKLSADTGNLLLQRPRLKQQPLLLHRKSEQPGGGGGPRKRKGFSQKRTNELEFASCKRVAVESATTPEYITRSPLHEISKACKNSQCDGRCLMCNTSTCILPWDHDTPAQPTTSTFLATEAGVHGAGKCSPLTVHNSHRHDPAWLADFDDEAIDEETISQLSESGAVDDLLTTFEFPESSSTLNMFPADSLFNNFLSQSPLYPSNCAQESSMLDVPCASMGRLFST